LQMWHVMLLRWNQFQFEDDVGVGAAARPCCYQHVSHVGAMFEGVD
jgi:hypothetical protein